MIMIMNAVSQALIILTVTTAALSQTLPTGCAWYTTGCPTGTINFAECSCDCPGSLLCCDQEVQTTYRFCCFSPDAMRAGPLQLDSPAPRKRKNLYFIGVAGGIAISLLLVVMAIVVIIRRYRQSKKVEACVDLNQHTPDSYNLKSPLSPRPSKLRITGQLLCPVDTKQLPVENAQNRTKIQENWKEESKETSYTDDCCCKLPNNNSPEDASPSIPVQVNGTTMHVPDHTEGMEELCYSSPNSSKFPKLNVPSSGQTIGYEQIQGYEKIQHYEQIQGYEKFCHCDVNLAQLVGEAETETAASTLASSKQTFGSNENIIQAQCHLADSCHECKEHNLEVSLTACKNPVQDIENITESNVVIIRVPLHLIVLAYKLNQILLLYQMTFMKMKVFKRMTRDLVLRDLIRTRVTMNGFVTMRGLNIVT